jgi:hypothetical protein
MPARIEPFDHSAYATYQFRLWGGTTRTNDPPSLELQEKLPLIAALASAVWISSTTAEEGNVTPFLLNSLPSVSGKRGC